MKIIIIAAKILTTYLIFRYIFVNFDVSKVFANIEIEKLIQIFLISFFILQIQLLAICMRLRYILLAGNYDIPLMKIYIINSMGGIFTQTPLSFIGGDAVRIYMLNQVIKDSKVSLSIIGSDRLIGLYGMLFCVIASIPLLMFENIYFYQLQYLFIFLMVLLSVSLVILKYLEKIITRFTKYKKIFFLIEYLNIIRKASNKNLLKSIVLSVVNYLLIANCFVAISKCLSSEVPSYYYFITTPIVMFLSMMPVSIGGWGVRELGINFIMNKLNVFSETIILTSIIYGIVVIFVLIPGVIKNYVRK